MSNVRSFPVSIEYVAPDKATLTQLKRKAIVLKRAIAKEQKRQYAQRLVLELQRKLSETIQAGEDL